MNLVKPLPSIAAGYRHTALLKSDGTVTAVGDNKYGQCDISGWRHPTTPKLVIKIMKAMRRFLSHGLLISLEDLFSQTRGSSPNSL